MRPMYLAGTWYPADAPACQAAIQPHAADIALEQASWRGIIAPHAGWRYSGRIAAGTFACLARAQPHADLVVIFGSHRGPQGPNTIFRAAAWDTPFGPLKVATDLALLLANRLQLTPEPEQPARPDNGIEVLLPLVRHFFPQAQALMLGVAAAPVALPVGEGVGAAVRQSGRHAIFVGSTDLTHYGPRFDFVPQGPGAQAVPWVRNVNDRGFINAACAGDAARMVQHGWQEHSACCPGAAAAALRAAQCYGTCGKVQLVRHELSYDTEPNDNYVGYAGLVF